uniref:Zinc finger GRF-type domain-containing protein n=1 Tax=Aegilops tauschii subsp. strangulata TaxID=200361 RepID=A0A453RHJ6_AEGTS
FNSFSLIASVVLPLFSALVLALSCNHHLSAGQNKCVHPCPREALHHLHPMSFPTRSSHSLSSVALSAVQCRARGPFQTIDPGRHFYSCDSHGVIGGCRFWKQKNKYIQYLGVSWSHNRHASLLGENQAWLENMLILCIANLVAVVVLFIS